MNKKITETSVAKLSVECLRDTEITGFQVRKRAKGKFFYFQYRSPVTQKQRRYALGKHGTLTVEQARDAARLLSGKVALGCDPLDEKHETIQEQEQQKNNSLRAFLDTGFCQVTPKKTAKLAIRTIELHFPEWLNRPMSEINAWDLDKWKRAYKGKPSGANRILASLRGVLSKAVKAGLIEKSPLVDVKKLKEDKNKKVRYLSDCEEQRLFEALDKRQDKQRDHRKHYILWCQQRGVEAPPPLNHMYTDHLKPMVILSLKTGLRLGEIFNLHISDIDMQGRVLTVEGEEDGERTGAKSGNSRQIPINDEVYTMLMAWIEQCQPRDLFFPSPKTGGRFHKDGIKSAWSGIKKTADLNNFRFHDLRHTFGTRLAHNRVDLVTIKELMGHESLDTTARYLHTSNELKIQALATI